MISRQFTGLARNAPLLRSRRFGVARTLWSMQARAASGHTQSYFSHPSDGDNLPVNTSAYANDRESLLHSQLFSQFRPLNNNLSESRFRGLPDVQTVSEKNIFRGDGYAVEVEIDGLDDNTENDTEMEEIRQFHDAHDISASEEAQMISQVRRIIKNYSPADDHKYAMSSVLKKRRKKMRKHKDRKRWKKTRPQRRRRAQQKKQERIDRENKEED